MNSKNIDFKAAVQNDVSWVLGREKFILIL